MTAAISTPPVEARSYASPSRHLPVITNSELRTFRRCPREHHYSYRLRRRPRTTSDALRFGTLLHLGLEAWWKTTIGDSEAKFIASIAALRAHPNVDPFDLVRAEELMLGYTARWCNEPHQAIAVEQRFEVPLVNPETGAKSRTYALSGKCDVIAAGCVIEHKTTSLDISLGSDYWRRVSALDSQVSMYLSGARAAGYEVGHCIYDVIRKPAQRPSKATPIEDRKYTKPTKLAPEPRLYANQRESDETAEEYRLRVREAIAESPDRYYARGEIVRLEHDEAEHAYDVWQTARSMREAELAGRYPRNPDACSRYGSMCPYFEVCSGEARIDDDVRFRTATEAHEELTAVEEIQS